MRHKKDFFLVLVVTFFSISLMGQPIFEDLPDQGEIIVTLHPGTTVTLGTTHLVSFGIPFPRNTVNNISQIVITDNDGNEISSDIKELTRWHSLSDDPEVSGVRSVLLQFNTTFNNLNPTTIKVVYGQNRTLELGDQGDVKDNWVVVQDPDDEYTDNTSDSNYVELKEPSVYATLPSEWMSKCVMRTKFISSDQVTTEYQWHNDAMINFGKSAINDVADTVLDEHKVNIYTRSPWLFDRAGCLWNLYLRTGELKWLKASHKASQFYASKINDRGIFEFATWDDLKYSFGGSMLIDLMLTGDTSLHNKIINVAEFAARENLRLEDGYRFWTERHFTYWLLGALSAFEATGNINYKTQINERAAHAFFRAKNPINGYQPEGGLLHPMGPHEGLNTPVDGAPDTQGYYQPIISPWLSALLSDAIWRYYLHSEDEQALRFLIGLGENVARHCIYEVTNVHPNINGNIQPYYLFSGQTDAQFARNGNYWKPWDDDKHAPDITGLLARVFWAQKKLNLDTSEIKPQIDHMIEASKYTIEAWTRTDPSRPRYRLQPARKFNWQFGTASDLEWLMTNDPTGTLSIDDFEEINKGQFSTYPNPVENILFINTTKKINQPFVKLGIYDIKGRKLDSHIIENMYNENSIDLSLLNTGIYFLRILSNSSKETIKFIKK